MYRAPCPTDYSIHITNRQRGGALIYILIAIAIIGTLTATLIEPVSQQAQAQKAFKLAQQIEGQITLIRSAIQECIINYPAGDPTINASTTTDSGYTPPFPIRPNSAHYTGSTLGAEVDNQANGIRCPGNPGVDQNHTPMFGPLAGRYFPVRADNNIGSWYYSNGSGVVHGAAFNGVFIQTGSTGNDQYIIDAFTKLAAKYNDCELDYLVGSGTNGCGSGHCIRYWFSRTAPAC